MPHQWVCWVLLVFLNSMVCASPPFYGDSSELTATITDNSNSHKLKTIHSTQLEFDRKLDSKQFHKRPKRGIVLIDEDFNVKPGDKGKKDGNDEKAFNSKVDSKLKNMFSANEGSGSSETMSDELILITSFTRPDSPQLTRLLDQKAVTGAIGNNLVKKSTRFAAATPDNIRQLGEEATDFAVEDIESSGDGDSSTNTRDIDTSKFTTGEDIFSEHTSPSTEGQETSRVTINEETSSMPTSPSTEGSSVTSSSGATEKDISSTTHVVELTESPTKLIDDAREDMCLNTTCDDNDLIILPNLSKLQPEGINLIVACSLPNATEEGLLKWYKFNSSEPLLEENSDENTTSLVITNTVLHHSGTYMCFKFSERFCCHKELEIAIYKVPNYKKHLIVVCSVAAASLLLCTLIAICKNLKAKKYEKQAAEDLQNAEKPFLL